MITARRKSDGSFEIANGHMRLKAQLQVQGKAEVVDSSTGKTFHVHQLDGRLASLSLIGKIDHANHPSM